MTTPTQPHDPIEGIIESFDEKMSHFKDIGCVCCQRYRANAKSKLTEAYELGRVAGVKEAKEVVKKSSIPGLNKAVIFISLTKLLCLEK